MCLWVHIRENNGLHNTDRFKSVSPKILVLNCFNRCNFKVDIIPNMFYRGGLSERTTVSTQKKNTHSCEQVFFSERSMYCDE